MAKKNKTDREWYLEHLIRATQFGGYVTRIYSSYVEDFARLAERSSYDPEKPFSFDDYPGAKEKVGRLMTKISGEIVAYIDRGTRQEWEESQKKNDSLVNRILSRSKLSREQVERFYNHNLDALDQFQKRKVQGMDLSSRVWKYTEQFKEELELGIDVALGEGRSADRLSRDLRSYLKEPEKLFRRVRDQRGNLQLSKNAKVYHPGQGVYRSSYKNAKRLATTEINMAYKTADQARWNNLPLVVGFEVKLSNNHPCNDICDRLAGRYPKDFIFRGWHPHCRCYIVSVLANDEEIDKMLDDVLDGKNPTVNSKNTVTDVPAGFKDWCKENADRVKGWSSTPYWIRDNFKEGDLSRGLSFRTKGINSVPISTKTVNPDPITPPKEYISPMCPPEFQKWPRKIDHTFYDLLESPPKVTHLPKGSYQSGGTVNIDLGTRFKESPVHQEKIIYHEVGHLIHNQRYNYRSQAVRDTMERMRASLRKKVDGVSSAGYVKAEKVIQKWDNFRYGRSVYNPELDKFVKFEQLSEERLKRFVGISFKDLSEYTCSTADTLMSLNAKYGYGHTKGYFKSAKYLPETEFLSHCFECYYSGNPIMKKAFPDLYDEMIKLVDTIKEEIKTGKNVTNRWSGW
nr:hypothetical protein [Parabacteroides goldsteinii]